MYNVFIRSFLHTTGVVTRHLLNNVTSIRDEIYDLNRTALAGLGFGATGRWGEHLALRFLRRRGCRLLAQNWRSRRYEADLILLDGRAVVVVEVKTRHITQRDTYPAHRAVSPEKLAHLSTVVDAFSRTHGPLYRRLGVRTHRIDTVEVYYQRTRLGRHRVVELSWHRGFDGQAGR